MPRAVETMMQAACALLIGCAGTSDAVELSHESADDQRFSYSFVASRRHSEPSACGAFPLAMQLVFEDELHKVSAVISSQTWPCDLHEDASTYDITCASPRDESTPVEAALSIVLYEPAAKSKIAGEATLTISTDSGSCEHSFALEGQLDD